MTRESLRKHHARIMKAFEFTPDREIYQSSKMVIDLLNKTEWIPVSERLPEESDNYLVTNDDGVVEMAYFAHPKDYAISKGEWREIWYEDDVIAWMPLPQPYKTESEET